VLIQVGFEVEDLVTVFAGVGVARMKIHVNSQISLRCELLAAHFTFKTFDA